MSGSSTGTDSHHTEEQEKERPYIGSVSNHHVIGRIGPQKIRNFQNLPPCGPVFQVANIVGSLLREALHPPYDLGSENVRILLNETEK